MANWGTLANDAIPAIFAQPYQMIFPVLAISITMFALNFIGDGLRDALDLSKNEKLPVLCIKTVWAGGFCY